MEYTLKIVAKARRELFAAQHWYEEQQFSLGDRFMKAFFDRTEIIKSTPLRFPLKNERREAKIKYFPYLIIFRVKRKSNIIYISSVFHTSRHPDKKYK